MRIQNEYSQEFESEAEVRQGDGIQVTGTILNRNIQILEYAYDLNIIKKSQITIEAPPPLECAANKIGLSINSSNTKYMFTGQLA